MTLRQALRHLFAAIALTLANSGAVALEANGVATLTQLGREVFHAAILLNSPTGKEEVLLEQTGDIALEVRVISTISRRSWSSIWTQGVAINNSLGDFSENAEDFSEMLNLFQGPLEPNDVVHIELEGGSQTRILVNNVVLAEHLSPAVFRLCLRSWIGPVPFSSQFKDQLLAKLPPSLSIANFNDIRPLPARRTQILAWINESPGVPDSDAATGNTPDLEDDIPVKPGPGQNLADADISMTIKDPEIESPASQPELPLQSLVPEPDTKVGPIEPPTRPVEKEETAPMSQDAQIASASLTETETLTTSNHTPGPRLDSLKLAETDRVRVTAQSLIAQQAYIQNVRREIYAVTEFPLSAMRRGLEGTVVASIVLDADGNLISVQIVEGADFEGFNKAILRAVQSAAPFPVFPADMDDRQFTITTPFAFRLAGN